ncbi:MAG: hypothetical protein AB8B94_17115 [Hyphomicrobiales bacterium]
MQIQYVECIEIAGNWAAIATALVAVIGYGKYICDKQTRKFALEKYLKAKKAADADKGQRTILHLIAKLGMTEAQIMEASFKSDKITRRLVKDDETGLSTEILLEWEE